MKKMEEIEACAALIEHEAVAFFDQQPLFASSSSQAQQAAGSNKAAKAFCGCPSTTPAVSGTPPATCSLKAASVWTTCGKDCQSCRQVGCIKCRASCGTAANRGQVCCRCICCGCPQAQPCVAKTTRNMSPLRGIQVEAGEAAKASPDLSIKLHQSWPHAVDEAAMPRACLQQAEATLRVLQQCYCI